jgi:ATP-dependent DNA helicase RecG
MRPEILFPAFAPVSSLPGIGPRNAKLVEKLAGPKIADLYWHLPTGLIDRRFAPKIAEAPAGTIATITVHIDSHIKPANPRLPYKVLCSDETGTLVLVFFHGQEDWFRRMLPVGSIRIVSGRLELFGQAIQMSHPDRIAAPEEAARLQTVEPIYPLTTGLQAKTLTKAIAAALDRAPKLLEWGDPAYCRRQGWPDWRSALIAAHHPMVEADLSPQAVPRVRLAYDELLANQLALALIRAHTRRIAGRRLVGDGRLRRKVLAALPYTLTNAQTQAVEEIITDLASGQRMLRLLHGDVGSGKTVVALLAMLVAVEEGTQCALMAPTEVLARQHYERLAPLANAAGARLGLLTGRDKGKTRAGMLTAIADGTVDILVGTHALFQEEVIFRDLALVVIDEQHRFGVHQRLTLAAKGSGEKGDAAVLVTTATPIPRTLTLTAYGDMAVSRLFEKPPGRQPIDTRAIPLERLAEVIEAVRRKVLSGDRIYWVCPLIADSEDVDLAAAEHRFRELSDLFGERVGLVHGRMKAPDKDAAMAHFAEGRTSILVATTVIEVGIDVPAATVIVIEHAERFGLAQLHQLRGRVGRGSDQSTCLLLYAGPLGDSAKARLQILRETEDGFRIAEEDLRLRGAGELLGTRQSGVAEFRLADLTVHADLLVAARDDARLILNHDPDLASDRGRALRALLYLFERDAAVRYLRSG